MTTSRSGCRWKWSAEAEIDNGTIHKTQAEPVGLCFDGFQTNPCSSYLPMRITLVDVLTEWPGILLVAIPLAIGMLCGFVWRGRGSPLLYAESFLAAFVLLLLLGFMEVFSFKNAQASLSNKVSWLLIWGFNGGIWGCISLSGTLLARILKGWVLQLWKKQV